MIKNAKILFYLSQFFKIRLAEKLYVYNHKKERFPITRAFIHIFLRIKYYNVFKTKKQIACECENLIYIESLNQKNAIIKIFEDHDRKKILFIHRNNIQVERFNSIKFNEVKQYLLSLLYFPEATLISHKYSVKNKNIINKSDIIIQLSLFLSSIKLFEQLLDVAKCKKVIITNDHNINNLALIFAAKTKGIRSYYIQHASVSMAFPKLLPDIALLEGQHSIDIYTKIGNYSKKIELVGIPRLDGLVGYKKYMNETNLTVGFCIKPCYSEILINDVVKSVRSSPKVTEIILRPHPGYPDSYYESINKYNSEISDSRKEISSSFLKRVDILISGESSIILEAAMMRVKSIYIDDKFSPFDLYGFIKNGVTEFAEVENIAHSIDNILFSEVQKNFINSKYYCDTINTINENKSKELIRKVLF